MQGRLAMVLALAWATGCGGEGAGGSLGSLAFSDPSGSIVVLDVGSGARRVIASPSGSPGAISLAPDRASVAFSVEPQLFERHVFVGDVDGDVHEVQPQTGESMAAFRWGIGGYFRYYVYTGGVSSEWVAQEDATVARRLGEFEPYPVTSPVEARIAYSECDQPPIDFQCTRRLVVERASGDEHVVLATGSGIVPIAFTPDGSELITMEDVEGARHLLVRSIDQVGPVRDLGLIDDVPYGFSNYSDDRKVVSPDGSEVLALRDGELIALSLVDGEARVIANFVPTEAEFASPGTILYMVEENLTPETDVPQYVYHLHVVSGAVSTQVIDAAQNCWFGPAVSRSGALAAWSCGWHVLTILLGEPIVVGDIGIGEHILGFDEGDTGVIVATSKPEPDVARFEIEFVSLTGEATWLGETPYQQTTTGYVEWPPFSYQP